MPHAWTRREITIVVKNYRTRGAAWCSRATGRTVSSVYQIAKVWNLSSKRDCLTDNQILSALKKLHPKGYTDSDIAQWLRSKYNKLVNRHRIGLLRKTLGLGSNKSSDRSRKRVARQTKRQLAAVGWASLSQARVESLNAWKRSLGWPEHLSMRSVQALEAFWQLGPGVPITRLQLCELMGVVPRKRTCPASNAAGGTVMAELQRAGFIESVRRGVPGTVSGKKGSQRQTGAGDVLLLEAWSSTQWEQD
jgi:hypothetical protein